MLAAAHLAEARDVRKPYRIGWLHFASANPRATFREALRALGYVEGRNLTFEVRLTDAKSDRLPALAAELVGAKVDVLVAVAPAAILAAKNATATIPIVMAYWGGPDPVESGLVLSLARPGGNVTGIHMLNTALDGNDSSYCSRPCRRRRRSRSPFTICPPSTGSSWARYARWPRAPA